MCNKTSFYQLLWEYIKYFLPKTPVKIARRKWYRIWKSSKIASITPLLTSCYSTSKTFFLMDSASSPSLLLCKYRYWLSRGGLHSVFSHKSDFGNQEIRQLELWNLAQWKILSLVPGKVLWRRSIGGLGDKINQLINQHLCEITRGPPPLALSNMMKLVIKKNSASYTSMTNF